MVSTLDPPIGVGQVGTPSVGLRRLDPPTQGLIRPRVDILPGKGLGGQVIDRGIGIDREGMPVGTRHLFAGHGDHVQSQALLRLDAVDRSLVVVVVGDHDHVEPQLTAPDHHLGRRAPPVRMEGVDVEIAAQRAAPIELGRGDEKVQPRQAFGRWHGEYVQQVLAAHGVPALDAQPALAIGLQFVLRQVGVLPGSTHADEIGAAGCEPPNGQRCGLVAGYGERQQFDRHGWPPLGEMKAL